MPDLSFETHLSVAGVDIAANSVVHFDYKQVWDRGSRVDLLIHDPSLRLHREMEGASGNPTPEVKFKLEYMTSRGAAYHNVGSDKTLYVQKIFLTTTHIGPCIVIRAVDKGSIKLRTMAKVFTQRSVKANAFIQNLCSEVGVTAEIPDTGDQASVHRARNLKTLAVIRYELDRVLSSGGKPITIQYDDRDEADRLIGFEEFYDVPTEELETQSGGSYTYGVRLADKPGPAATWGSAAHEFRIGVDFAELHWGHRVDAQQLLSDNSAVFGEVEPKLDGNLGFGAEILNEAIERMHIARTFTDDATSDDYYHRSTLVNRVFQSEMSLTSGHVIIDCDFKAYDDPSILNRKHIYVAVSSGENEEPKHALIPNECVVMGYQHILNVNGAFTRVLVRRGK